MDGLAGLAGWQWVFLCEGLPAVLCSFVAYRVLLDSPRDVSWLTDEEKDWLVQKLAGERATKPMGSSTSMWSVCTKPQVWHFALIYTTLNIGFYGILFWLPQIVKGMAGTNNMITSILSAIPWITAIVVMGFVAGYADRCPGPSGRDVFPQLSRPGPGLPVSVNGLL